MGGETVRGHYVETHTREQHYAGLDGCLIQRRQTLEYLDLAGDVEIVHAPAQTGLRHGPESVHKRAGTVEYQAPLQEGLVQGGRVTQVQRHARQAVAFRQDFEPVRVASGQQRTQALFQRLFHDEGAGVTVGPINQHAGPPWG